MMKHWEWPILVLASLAQLGAGPVQQVPRHLAIVMEGHTARIQPQEQGLRDGLEELGYIDGKNLVIEKITEDDYERLRASVTSHLQRQRVELLVTLGTAETTAAKEATPKIPIVFLPAEDPVRSGFVNSLAMPGTNLTGLTFYTGFENIGKQLEVFKDVVPSLGRVLTFFDDRDPNRSKRLKTARSIASRLALELIEQPVGSVAKAMKVLASPPAKATGVFVICSGLFKDLKGLASMANKYRLPLFGCNAFQVAEQGVLLSYAPDLYSIGYRGAGFVDQILKGAKPQTLPVETPAKFDLAINRNAAAAIGLKIPPEILILADRVFD